MAETEVEEQTDAAQSDAPTPKWQFWKRADRDAAPAPVRTRRVRLEDRAEKKSWRPEFLQYKRNNSREEVADAVRSLGIMLATARGESGPLQALAQQYKDSEMGAAFERIYTGVMSGQQSMAEGFRAESKVFPRIVADLAYVGSRAGTESDTLQRAADIISEGQDIQQKVKSALTQPVILLLVIVAFLYGVILFVLPVFSDMFAQLNQPLPPLSEAVMTMGDVIIWGGSGLALVIVGWFVYYKFYGRKIEKLRIVLGRIQLKLPVLGHLLRAQHLTRSFSILAGLMDVGMNERNSLLTAAQATGNAAISQHIRLHVDAMDAGEVAFADIADGKLIPLPIGFLLKNGFDSGAGVVALENVTTQFRREASRRADNLTRRLEPIANGAVGVIFAFVLVATYLPVYQMMVGLSGGV